MAISPLSGLSSLSGISDPSSGISQAGGISSIPGGGPIPPQTCEYPLDETVFPPPITEGLVMSGADQTGTLTMVGAPASDVIAAAAPVGAFGGTSLQMDLTQGDVTVQAVLSADLPVDTASVTEAFRSSLNINTPALANIATVALKAMKDGTYSLEVFRGAGLTSVCNVDGLSGGRVPVAVRFDSGGTFSVVAGGHVLTLSDNTFTPGDAVVLLVCNEFTISDAGDAGKTASGTLISCAEDMFAIPVQSGATDWVGDALTAVSATLDPAAKGALITLSGGDLTATNTSGGDWDSVLATISKTGDDWFFQLTQNLNGGFSIIGIGQEDADTASFAGGADGKSIGYFSFSGAKLQNGADSSMGDAWGTAGSVVGCRFNEVGVEFYKLVAGAWVGYGPIAHGLTGPIKPMISVYSTAAEVTANFGATSLSAIAPDGANGGVYA